ncbi:RNA polymerase II elongation factor ELL2-like [Hypomesus transpacificus]|uniref:RNA polymerase II elongation factor ELL2-like n=1 Tax=Hypomesus transpacificus TaxID=137520 RepID=UPI001F077637|nr:RNA polymerase II elongation factor ELL2-like [Hypomesus transpacificus]
MAALRQEHRYGLSCGKIDKNIPNKTLYHVKLTDTAIRALEAYQNLKGCLPNQPSICFKGHQGYVKIPTVSPESPAALRLFSFYLSSDSKDQPQASFECVHQYVSSAGREQLKSQGSILDKITVCATDDSYQMTRERMSQVEKDIWSRSAIEIKPGATHPSKCVKLQKKPTPLSTSDSLHKHSPTNRRNSALGLLTQRPLRERIIHLLALKPYRKPELLLWLERERASPKDKAELGSLLDEVAKVNPKDNSFLLKDECYRLVQRDWPGYVEEEKQLVNKLLARKLQLQSSSQSRTFQANSTNSFHKTSWDSPLHHTSVKNPAGKRPLPSDSLDSPALKKQRLIDQRLHLQPTTNGLSNCKDQSPSLNPIFNTNTAFQRTSNHISNSQNGFLPPMDKLSSSTDDHTSERGEHSPQVTGQETLQNDSECVQQQLANSQHKKKKSKKHKEKERERLKDRQTSEWLENSPNIKQIQDKPYEPAITNAVPVVEEKPDYVLAYSPVSNAEQRQRYQVDFCAEYDEYKDLHSRIATITHMFVQLGSKIKSLSPGTQEYKIMEDQILDKYKKYRKKFPGYREEKKRCEYLHQKLSHIKQLITDFDLSHNPS